MKLTEKPDEITKRVAAAIDAVESNKKWRIIIAYSRLAKLNVGDVFAELILCVEDITIGIDKDKLLSAGKFHPRFNPQEMLGALENRDLATFKKAAGANDDMHQLFTSLIVFAVVLKETRAKLGW